MKYIYIFNLYKIAILWYWWANDFFKKHWSQIFMKLKYLVWITCYIVANLSLNRIDLLYAHINNGLKSKMYYVSN
jgi:hypothetical protein